MRGTARPSPEKGLTMRGWQVGSILKDEPWLKLQPAFLEFYAAANNPEVPTTDVAAVISSDAELSACVLRLANSVLFDFERQIDTPIAAMEQIGRLQVADLALTGMAFHTLVNIHPDIVTAQSFWHHSISCALVARELGIMRNDANVESYFAAGMLHDVGSLLFYTHINERDLMKILHSRNAGIPLFQIERDLLHFDHAELGGALLDSWNMPQQLSVAIAYHHHPEQALEHQLHASVIHVADIISNAMGFGSRGQHRVPPLSEGAWEQLGLSHSQLPELIDRIDQKAHRVLELFWQK